MKRSKNHYIFILLIIMLNYSCKTEPVRNVNPNATRQAKELLNFLYEIQGKYTLSGQHNFIADGSKYTDSIKII